MTTYAAFYDALQAMAVTGVTRHYDNPPASLDTADLPAAFPLLPDGSKVEGGYTCIVAKERRCQFVICIDAAGQGTMSENTEALIPLMDNLETAIDSLTVMPLIEYTIEAGTVAVAEQEYWGITAEITARDADV